MIDDFNFMKKLKHFSFQEKMEIVKLFKLKKINAGQRFFADSDRTNSFNLILNGTVGIFHADRAKIKNIADQPGRLQICN